MKDHCLEVYGPVIVQDSVNERHKFLIDKDSKEKFPDLLAFFDFMELRNRTRPWHKNLKVRV